MATAAHQLQHHPNLKYVLITPARNEADLIEGVMQSVVSQSFLPEKWVVVSDGSNDGTDEIVQKYADQHSWIELLRLPEHRDRVREMAAMIRIWQQETGDTMPLPAV